MDIGAALLPLVGVVLGTAGTLTGQYLATRGEARRHADGRAAERRAERKAVIATYLEAVQRVERFIGDRPAGAEPHELLHALWLAKKLLELVCSAELATAAHKYTSTLDTLARGPAVDAPSRPLMDRRAEFMETARTELGTGGPRLYPG